MQLLQDRIKKDGMIRPGNVLKVDNFLNHQIDVDLMDQLGEEFYNHFKGKNINKIITIESSGIGIACMTARHFHIPVVFAKKTKTSQLDDELYSAEVHSYTHNNEYCAVISKRFLTKEDHVLIVDDFLANGAASRGMLELVRQAGATLEGIGIVIEKGFQPGGDDLRKAGVDLLSLAIVQSMDAETQNITFREV